MKNKTAKELLHYIKRSTSPFQVVKESAALLEQEGFEPLSLGEAWKLKKKGTYYVDVYGTTLFAFTIGGKFRQGASMHLVAAHTDHPCLRVKPRAEMNDKGYLKLDIEVYGGALQATWLDRPLSIAGKVSLKSDDIYHPETRLVDFAKPLLTIPNLAIHMNRDANKGFELNRQTEMLPLIGLLTESLEKDSFFVKHLAKELKVPADRILDFDLYVYNAEEGCTLGLQEEFISCPRLDNLTSCFAALTAITAAKADLADCERLNVIALYDNEEIGSRTKQGADSLVTNLLLEKIYAGLGFDRQGLLDSLPSSMMLSLDVAHGYHPNYGQKSDPNLACRLGDGPVIKINYSQRYATDTEAIAVVEQLCLANKVPYQKYVNRSDIPGGGTLGTITSAYLPMPTVDIGIPLLAMHSARELMGTADQDSLNSLAYCFFL